MTVGASHAMDWQANAASRGAFARASKVWQTESNLFVIRRNGREKVTRPAAPSSRLSPFVFSHYVSRKLEELRSLRANADNDEVQAVSQQATYAMYNVLTQLGDRRSVFPHLTPTGDGGVLAEWHAGNRRIEIESSDEGVVYAYIADSERLTSMDEEMTAESIGNVAAALADLSALVRDLNPGWRRLFIAR